MKKSKYAKLTQSSRNVSQNVQFGALPLDCIYEILDYLPAVIALSRDFVRIMYERGRNVQWYARYVKVIPENIRDVFKPLSYEDNITVDWRIHVARIMLDLPAYIDDHIQFIDSCENYKFKSDEIHKIKLNSKYHALPVELLHQFLIVNASRIGITHIPDVNLSKCQMHSLNLAYNRLSYVPDALFDITAEYLILSHNRLTFIPTSAITARIKNVFFVGNSITTAYRDRCALVALLPIKSNIVPKTIYLANTETYYNPSINLEDVTGVTLTYTCLYCF